MANELLNIIRLLKAVNLLASPNGTTVKKLADRLGISRRSVFRLLRTLEELGFPLSDDKPKLKSEKRYRLAESYVIKLPNNAILNPSLTSEEIIFILSVLDVCKKFNMPGKTSITKSVKEKLTAMLPAGERGSK